MKNVSDVDNFIDNLVQPLYQKLLDAELENMLNYVNANIKKDKEDNYTNSYCKTKKVQTKYGIMSLKTSRDRNADFNQVIAPKGENRLGQFEDIVLSLCAKESVIEIFQKYLYSS